MFLQRLANGGVAMPGVGGDGGRAEVDPLVTAGVGDLVAVGFVPDDGRLVTVDARKHARGIAEPRECLRSGQGGDDPPMSRFDRRGLFGVVQKRVVQNRFVGWVQRYFSNACRMLLPTWLASTFEPVPLKWTFFGR